MKENVIFDADMNPIGVIENGEFVKKEVVVEALVLQELKANNEKRKLEFKKEQQAQAIETHIYANYSQLSQIQDQVWTDNFRTKLVAMGITDVELKVVGGVKAFYAGKTPEEYLKDEQVEAIPLFAKLIKIAIRSEWAFRCIQESKKAIVENREPVYAEFPQL